MNDSPNSNHSANLIYENEIRFGPAYCRLELNGQLLSNRLFGQKLKWSPCSTFLALEEWLTTDYIQGPKTRLFLVNVEEYNYSEFRPINKGFVKKVSFDNGNVKYVKEFPATGNSLEAEVEISKIKNWSKIGL
jgi:hypothetical protein